MCETGTQIPLESLGAFPHHVKARSPLRLMEIFPLGFMGSFGPSQAVSLNLSQAWCWCLSLLSSSLPKNCELFSLPCLNLLHIQKQGLSEKGQGGENDSNWDAEPPGPKKPLECSADAQTTACPGESHRRSTATFILPESAALPCAPREAWTSVSFSLWGLNFALEQDGERKLAHVFHKELDLDENRH